MKIAEGIAVLELESRAGTIYPVLFWCKDTITLIDAGYRDMLPIIKQTMAAEGIPFERLTNVVLTHHDRDHTGSLAAIKDASCQKVQVLAHSAEVPYLVGTLLMKKIKPDYMKKMLAGLTEAQQVELEREYSTPLCLSVDMTIEDGQTLPGLSEVVVIHTPGHTPGHICLYHKLSKTLVAGDNMIVIDGQMYGPVADVTKDLTLAYVSLQKLAAFDIETVICYHGGIFKNASQRVTEIISA